MAFSNNGEEDAGKIAEVRAFHLLTQRVIQVLFLVETLKARELKRE